MRACACEIDGEGERETHQNFDSANALNFIIQLNNRNVLGIDTRMSKY